MDKADADKLRKLNAHLNAWAFGKKPKPRKRTRLQVYMDKKRADLLRRVQAKQNRPTPGK